MEQPCLRCGQHEEDDSWPECRVNGRELVRCDSNKCLAFAEPITVDEIQAAYKHWRSHSYMHGCSHGQ